MVASPLDLPYSIIVPPPTTVISRSLVKHQDLMDVSVEIVRQDNGEAEVGTNPESQVKTVEVNRDRHTSCYQNISDVLQNIYGVGYLEVYNLGMGRHQVCRRKTGTIALNDDWLYKPTYIFYRIECALALSDNNPVKSSKVALG